jgi:hypothetical protein
MISRGFWTPSLKSATSRSTIIFLASAGVVPSKQLIHQQAPRILDFGPLAEEEKKEFVNSLDAKGKQILAKLAGEAEEFK